MTSTKNRKLLQRTQLGKKRNPDTEHPHLHNAAGIPTVCEFIVKIKFVMKDDMPERLRGTRAKPILYQEDAQSERFCSNVM